MKYNYKIFFEEYKLKLLNKEFIKLFVDETKIYDNLLMYNKNMFLLNIYMD
jgi:hypothetical protein